MGLFNAYGKAFDERERNVERFNKRYNEGELTLPELTIHNLGQAMGSITDIGFVPIAEGAKGLFGMLPEDVQKETKEYIKETAMDAARSDVGQATSEFFKETPWARRAGELALSASEFWGTGLIKRGGKEIAENTFDAITDPILPLVRDDTGKIRFAENLSEAKKEINVGKAGLAATALQSTGKVARGSAANMMNFVEGFYSSGPIGQGKLSIKKFSGGVLDNMLQQISPFGQQLLRTEGIPRGAKKYISRDIRLIEDVNKYLKDGTTNKNISKLKNEYAGQINDFKKRYARERVNPRTDVGKSVGTADEISFEQFLEKNKVKTFEEFAGYKQRFAAQTIAGQIVQTGLLQKQLGIDIPIINKTILNPGEGIYHSMGTFNKSFWDDMVSKSNMDHLNTTETDAVFRSIAQVQGIKASEEWSGNVLGNVKQAYRSGGDLSRDVATTKRDHFEAMNTNIPGGIGGKIKFTVDKIKEHGLDIVKEYKKSPLKYVEDGPTYNNITGTFKEFGGEFSSKGELISALKAKGLKIMNEDRILGKGDFEKIGPDLDQPVLIVGNSKSSAYELGGTATTHLVQPDGTITSFVHDMHNLMGVVPSGGKNMITISEPIVSKLKQSSKSFAQDLPEMLKGSAKARQISHMERETGISRQGLYKIIKGESIPTQKTLEKLAKYYDVPIGSASRTSVDMFGGIDEVGKKLASYLKKRGISYRDFGDEIGVTHGAVESWLQKKGSEITSENMEKLASVLNLEKKYVTDEVFDYQMLTPLTNNTKKTETKSLIPDKVTDQEIDDFRGMFTTQKSQVTGHYLPDSIAAAALAIDKAKPNMRGMVPMDLFRAGEYGVRKLGGRPAAAEARQAYLDNENN
jgi:transcriptional regulator with XRE-family HTH domain